MSAAANYQRLVERLADQGQPLELNAHDLATVLAHEPGVLVDVMSKTTVVQSVTKTLREGRDLTIETAACIGAAIAGALKAQAERYVRNDVSCELGRRRFGIGGHEAGSRSTH